MALHLITAALPYANGPIHIGHLAGAYFPADIYARHLRSKDEEVLFISGSDEGGVAILLQARKEGVRPEALVDRYHQRNQATFEAIGIGFDFFFRTSDQLHHTTAQAFFKKLHQQGLLHQEECMQHYDPVEKCFLADRYLQGTCPHCAYKGAYGDQCEGCGSSLDPTTLLNVESRLSKATPIQKATTHWYFPLDQYGPWLKEWILSKQGLWKNNVYGQCMSWLNQGLQPRTITRDLEWGVPVPLKEEAGKALYVWFEAPIGYISATKAWAQKVGKPWEAYWQDPATKLVNFIGKDNIVFHCLIFPAMLKAHGGFLLPTNVAANEFMNLEGKKISTSRNHALWVEDFLVQHPDKEDVLRYVLCANAPETKDSNFTWTDFLTRNNSELVGILGNFVHRTFVLTHQYFQGEVPKATKVLPIDLELQKNALQLRLKVEKAIENFHFRQAQADFIELARIGNHYLATTQPWHQIASDRERVKTILYYALQLVAQMAVWGDPFLPFTMAKVAKMLNLPSGWRKKKAFAGLPSGSVLAKPHFLFEKLNPATFKPAGIFV